MLRKTPVALLGPRPALPSRLVSALALVTPGAASCGLFCKFRAGREFAEPLCCETIFDYVSDRREVRRKQRFRPAPRFSEPQCSRSLSLVALHKHMHIFARVRIIYFKFAV